VTRFGSNGQWYPLIALHVFGISTVTPALFSYVWSNAKSYIPPLSDQTLLIEAMGEFPKAFYKEELAVFEALPDPFTIYRGFAGRNRKSRSWTLSKETATWFSTRWNKPDPHVVSLKVQKSDVLFYSHVDGRNENEIILRTPRCARLKRKARKFTKAQAKAQSERMARLWAEHFHDQA
jgi:hypothetical protein